LQVPIFSQGKETPTLISSLKKAVAYVYARLLRYALKFGVVGLVGYVIDVGIFNGLSLGLVGHGTFFQSPIGAKIVSVTISTIVSWLGNRYWTFRENRRRNFVLELLEFAAIAVVGLGISLGILYLSHYVFGFTSLLADNISGNVIGLFFATAFRFLMYRFWVYGPNRADGAATLARAEAQRQQGAEIDGAGQAPAP
jgi:putative flippase GtrA